MIAYVPAPPVCPPPLSSGHFVAEKAIGIDCVPDGAIDNNIDGCLDPGTDGVTVPTLPVLWRKFDFPRSTKIFASFRGVWTHKTISGLDRWHSTQRNYEDEAANHTREIKFCSR